MWLEYVYGMSVAARSLVVRSNAALFHLPTYIKTVFACYAAKTPGDAKAVPRSAINDAESLQMERQAFERVLALPISLKHTFFTYSRINLLCVSDLEFCLYLVQRKFEESVSWQ